jgi:hypothetical protein
MSREEDVMAAKMEWGVIEITEEAYKQNSVYRPWNEITLDRIAAHGGTVGTQQRERPVLAPVSPSLVAGGN